MTSNEFLLISGLSPNAIYTLFNFNYRVSETILNIG